MNCNCKEHYKCSTCLLKNTWESLSKKEQLKLKRYSELVDKGCNNFTPKEYTTFKNLAIWVTENDLTASIYDVAKENGLC